MDQIKQLITEFWHYLPYLVGGIAVLVVGWLVAWVAAGIIRRLIKRDASGRPSWNGLWAKSQVSGAELPIWQLRQCFGSSCPYGDF